VTISKGDGSMQRLIDNDQCPKCRTAISRKAIGKTLGNDQKDVYQCHICKLIIEGYKKD